VNWGLVPVKVSCRPVVRLGTWLVQISPLESKKAKTKSFILTALIFALWEPLLGLHLCLGSGLVHGDNIVKHCHGVAAYHQQRSLIQFHHLFLHAVRQQVLDPFHKLLSEAEIMM
jgi:hypothetical protein